MRCSITLADDRHVYYPGDEIKGIVKYTFFSVTNIRGIKLIIYGFAHTQWSIRQKYWSNGQNVTESVPMYGHEDYVGFKHYLIGSANDNHVIPVGEMTYSFSCVLPKNIPSSYEGTWGNVRYGVKVILHKRWGADGVNNLDFKVLAHLNLNDHSRHSRPKTVIIQKKYPVCFLWATKPMSITASMPQTGFVPGEKIPITVECKNATHVGIYNIIIILRRKEEFTAESPRRETKQHCRELAKVDVGGCPSGRSFIRWPTFKVPKIPPSNLENCKIIKVTYDLLFYIRVSVSRYLSKSIDITIGTIPLTPCQNTQQVDPISHQQLQTEIAQAIGWSTEISDASQSITRPTAVENEIIHPHPVPVIIPPTPTAPAYPGFPSPPVRHRPSPKPSAPEVEEPPPTYEESQRVVSCRPPAAWRSSIQPPLN